MNRYLPDIYSKSVLTINYDKLKKDKIKCLILAFMLLNLNCKLNTLFQI